MNNTLHVPSIFPVACHTDNVGQHSTFVAIEGAKQNGVEYIPLALQKGARTIVIQETSIVPDTVLAHIAQSNAHLIRVPDTRAALASLSAAAAEYPAHKLSCIGITGTKGKTTIVYLLEHILRFSGISVARITGVSNSINGHEIPANLTTPQPDYLHQFLKLCVEQNVSHVVMEVAAQALSLHRVDTIAFDRVVFTNIAREHLEFYQNMDDYFSAKCQIFNHLTSNALCYVNGDDERCASLIDNITLPIARYGFNDMHEKSAQDFSLHGYVTITSQNTTYRCPSLIGHYNASNLLAACIIAESYGINPATIQKALATFPTIPGRMEKYSLPNGATCIIDYAHNPSSYEALLSTLRPLTDHLIVLFGASGSRDKGKRPMMGAIAATYADTVILTSDNPGTADIHAIMTDIQAGIAPSHLYKVIKEADRTRAIQRGYELSKPGSLLVLLGKGRDEYQVIGTTKHYFSERNLIQQL